MVSQYVFITILNAIQIQKLKAQSQADRKHVPYKKVMARTSNTP